VAGFFRAEITGAWDELRFVLGDAATLMMETIDAYIQCLFTQVLQLDPRWHEGNWGSLYAKPLVPAR
jgi:hypothetical protein